MMLSLHNISFTHESAMDRLFDGISASFPMGWTGIVGANGTGKTTLLRLACGELEPEQGFIHRPARMIYCRQRTDDPPELLEEIIESLDADACTIRGRLGIEEDWLARWDTLSHGERKRAQIGVALWQSPDVLAVDEPTNHIDADARRLLLEAMKSFRGIGLLVSHDRELLDSLCGQCLFIDPPTAVMRPGGYTEAVAQAESEDQHQRDEYAKVKREAKRVTTESARRRQEASRADATMSMRKISSRDHDAKGKIQLARFTGADGNAGRLTSQLDGRVRQAQERLSEFHIKRRYDLDFWLPGSRCRRDVLFTVPSDSIEMGDDRMLTFPELSMLPDDRIAITGPNGAGKSTLIRHILDHLDLPEEKVVYLPQEIDISTSRSIMAEVNSLARDRLGQVMTIVSCLGSRPERLIDNTDASPGEIRKVMLALGVTRAPYLIILDEPTNHLDLPAIECLEDALDGCPCGLLLVSHDYRFLSRLAKTRWYLSREDGATHDVRLRITDMRAEDLHSGG